MEEDVVGVLDNVVKVSGAKLHGGDSLTTRQGELSFPQANYKFAAAAAYQLMAAEVIHQVSGEG